MNSSEYAYLHGYLSGTVKSAIKRIDSGVMEIVGTDGMRSDLVRALNEIERVKLEGINGEISEVRNGSSKTTG